MIKNGLVVDLVLFLGSILIYYYFISRAKKNPPALRRLPALDSIDEIVGRAAEMDRPIHFTAGGGTVSGLARLADSTSAMLVAGYSVLSKVAEACAKYKCSFFVTGTNIEAIPLMQETIENAYRRQGVPELVNPTEMIIVSSPAQYAHQYLCQDLFQIRHIAGNILFGQVGGSMPMLCQAAFDVGAVQLISIPQVSQGGFVAAVADYYVLGPEMYVAGAMLSQEPDQLGSVVGGDVITVVCIVITVLGYLALNFGSTAIRDILNSL